VIADWFSNCRTSGLSHPLKPGLIFTEPGPAARMRKQRTGV